MYLLNVLLIKNILILLIILIGSNFLLSCSSKTPTTNQDSYRYVDSDILVDETVMNYSLAIPKSYSSKTPVPLVLALHYGGRFTPDYGNIFLFDLVKPALENLNAIMVAPTCPTNQGWANSTSEKIVMALLRKIQSNYSIDSNRVLVTGYSLGAIGTYYFAARQSQFFTAAIPVSGKPSSQIISELKDVPLYIIHSRQDEVFPFATIEKLVQDLVELGKNVELKAVEDLTHYNTGDFTAPLRSAIPWLREVWGDR